MTTTVRAKMRLTAVTDHEGGSRTLKFWTQYDPSIPEDQRFQKATPSGSIEMMVDNQAVLPHFVLGKHYYVDFVLAEPVAVAA